MHLHPSILRRRDGRATDFPPLGRVTIRDRLGGYLADPPGADGELARLVGWEGNWVLDDPSDAGAARFLRELAVMLREVIGEVS